MSLAYPWLLTPDALAKGLLFHGSAARWNDPRPGAGGYDGTFWTAESPLIAQTYIPRWGMTTYYSPNAYNPREEVRPEKSGFAWGVAQILGARAEVIEWDHLDHAKRWHWGGKRVTHHDVHEHIKALGYTTDHNGNYSIKTCQKALGEDEKFSIPIPADRQPLGRLLLVEPPADLKLANLAHGESDLTRVEYHQVHRFNAAFEQGYQAVRINDFCQSPEWGNVGHPSIGFSSEAIDFLFSQGHVVTIPATHRDFGHNLAEQLTEDFEQWHFGEVVRALTLGFPTPPEVIDAHQARFDALMANWHADAAVHIPVLLDGATAQKVPVSGLPPTDADVQRVADGLREAVFDQGSAIFTLDAQGQLHCRLGAEIVEAARQTGLALSVQAIPLDQDGIGLTFGRLQEAIDYARSPADPAPSL